MAKLPETFILPFDEAVLAGPDQTARVQYFRDLIRTLKRSLEEAARVINVNDGFSGASPLIISAGRITLPEGGVKFRNHTVDAESMAASDDLDAVDGGYAGDMLLLSAVDDARTIVVKDGLSLNLAGDFNLDHTGDKLLLVCVESGVWHEVSRSGNGA